MQNIDQKAVVLSSGAGFEEMRSSQTATTMRARNLFNGEDHVLGVYGTVSTPAATEAIMQADCVLAFGTLPNSHSTAQGSFVEGKMDARNRDRPFLINVTRAPHRMTMW